jgi:hypothetical protein
MEVTFLPCRCHPEDDVHHPVLVHTVSRTHVRQAKMEVQLLSRRSPAGDDKNAVSLVDSPCVPILGAGDYAYSEHDGLMDRTMDRTAFAPILGTGDWAILGAGDYACSEHAVLMVGTAFAPSILGPGDFVYSGRFVDNVFRLVCLDDASCTAHRRKQSSGRACAPFGGPFHPSFHLHASSCRTCRGQLEVN